MRILQIANFVSPTSGGLKTAIDVLRCGYERYGWEVFRLTPFPDAQCAQDIQNPPSWRIPTMGGYRAIVHRRYVKEQILKIAPDVIELSDKTTLSWIPKWSRQNGIACCVISHERLDLTLKHSGLFSIPLLWMARRWTRSIEREATHVVCATRFAAEEFTQLGEQLRIIPLGVDLETIEPRLICGDVDDTVNVVVCGRLSHEKSPHLAVEAIGLLCPRLPITLTVVGDGPLRHELEKRAVGLPVHFVGHVNDRKKVFRILRDADVVVNMGQCETFGLVTLEALASGTPVVVAPTGASPELVDGQCGVTAAPNSEAVADAILQLIQSNSNSLRRQSRHHAEQYSWTRTIESLRDLYLSVTPRVHV